MMLLVYWYAIREQVPDFPHGPCAGLTSDVEIPVAESTVTLRWGDTAAIQVTEENHGEVLHTADVRVFKTERGVLQIREVDDERRAGGSEGGIAVATGRQQQAMVELPDGTRIRLNAQSTLHYAPGKEKAEQIKIQGEAYVQRPNATNTVPLIIGTSSGYIESAHGDFALLSLNNLTRAAALDGELSLQANRHDDTVLLSCYGAQGSIRTYATAQKGVFKDSLKYEGITDTDAILVWTKAVRMYKDVPLREFVAQMSIWYGFRVKDYHCLPADRRITTTVCYRKDKEAVFAAIREAGVLLYESKGIISFCPEDAQVPKNRGTMLASGK